MAAEEPEDEDGGGDEEKAEGLAAAEEGGLALARHSLGYLLAVRFDAQLDHAAAISRTSIEEANVTAGCGSGLTSGGWFAVISFWSPARLRQAREEARR